MKNIKSLIVVIFAITFSTSFSQEKFATHNNAYDKETYKIELSIGGKKKFGLYIDAYSMDEIHKTGGFCIDHKQYQSFITALNEAKQKYEEWTKTAKKNNVRDLDKTMPIKSKVDTYFLYGRDWHYDFSVNLSFDFEIFDTEREPMYLLVISTGKLQSSSNQFMKVDGFDLVFTSEEDIEKFMDDISLQKIYDFINEPKAGELFK